MNNQNQTNDSLFTEIELDEAVNVNGGFGPSYWMSLRPNRFRLRRKVRRSIRTGNFRSFDRNLAGILAPLRRAGIRI